jgi:hypothetical protein
MLITCVMHWPNTSKPLESTTLYKFVQIMLQAREVHRLSNLSFSKSFLFIDCHFFYNRNRNVVFDLIFGLLGTILLRQDGRCE